MSDNNQKSAFEFLGDETMSEMRPISAANLRQSSIRTRLFRTVVTCFLVIGGLVVVVPLLPDTDTKAAQIIKPQASLADHADMSTDMTAPSSLAQASAERQDVVYHHTAPIYPRQRI